MKPRHALVACSLLGVIYVSGCGSDSKKNVAHGEAGEGGEGGEPGGAGAGGVPAESEGGAGGVPSAPLAGAAGTPAGGLGGEGGEPPAPICFELEGEGGAGGAPPAPPVHFRCEDITGVYDPTQKKLILDLPEGTEPTLSGSFSSNYEYNVDTTPLFDCVDGFVTNTGSALELSADFPDGLTSVEVFGLKLADACDSEVELDTSGASESFCWGIRATNYDGEGSWEVDCYEGYGEFCAPRCADVTTN